jgi:hypothetical protein
MSPVALLKAMLESSIGADAPGGVVIGPATDAKQQLGVIQLMAAGLPKEEQYAPLLWQRVQVRCVGPTLLVAEVIAGLILLRLNNTSRATVPQASTNKTWLVHSLRVIGGPSMHFDTPETWETLLFAELMVGTQPVGDI